MDATLSRWTSRGCAWLLAAAGVGATGCYEGLGRTGAHEDGGSGGTDSATVDTEGASAGSGSDTDGDERPPTLGCDDARTFFEDVVFPGVLATNCLGCHSAGGLGSNSTFRLEVESDLDHLVNNWDTVRSFAAAGLLLDKPSGAVPHGGGAVLLEGTPEHALLAEFVARVQSGDEEVCPPFDGLALTQGFTLEPAEVSLARAKLAIHGGLLDADELARLERDGYDATVDALMGTWVQASGFLDPEHGALSAVVDEHLGLRANYRSRGFQKFCLNANEQYPHAKNEKKVMGQHVSDSQKAYVSKHIRTDDVSQAVAVGVNALASHLVKHELPLTELLLADYMMVSEESGRLYFPPEGWVPDQTAHAGTFVPPSVDTFVTEYDEELGYGKAKPLSTGREHVGVLSHDLFLCACQGALGSMEYPQGTQGWRKYKVSEQNNYRRTANCVAESFLGYSLFDFASRVPPTDDPDGESHPARLTDCQSCHNHIEELASFFTDFNERGYYMPGFGHPFVSIPVEDGLGPGFLGEPMPAGTDAPLRWLAEQVAAHPRFATTMSRRLLFPLLMGRAVESPPRQIATPEDLVLARVRRVDEAVAEDVAVVLMDEGYQVAPALAHLAKSRLFRAEGVEPDVEPAVAEILSASGSAAVVPPSTLHRFIDAVFGEPWLAPYKNQAWVPGLVDFRLDWRTLAGGLDGWSVTARPRDTVTALTSSALEHVAFSMACAVVPAQVADAGATQTLLPFVDRGDAPGDTAFDDNLAYLYRRFTSRELGTEEQLEMEHLYASAAATSGPACGQDDPAVRGWVAVVVYLFTHANTLIR